MSSHINNGRLVPVSLLAVMFFASISIAVFPMVTAAPQAQGSCQTTLPSTTLVAAPPQGAKGPDDLALLSVHGLDGGQEMLWTAYQNGINPDGTPGTPGGATQSTLTGYDAATGALITTIQVTGKLDGIAADQPHGEILATSNEDDNSVFNVVDVAAGTVTTYSYSPSPAVNGVGGTDSIAVDGGNVYISHSNPSDTTQATQYEVSLNDKTLTASLTAVFYDDSMATDVNTGATVQMGLTDPDTNFIMPHAGEAFGGDLATISQGDGVIVFAAHPESHAALSILATSDNVPGNAPPLDGLAVATSNGGTLYVVDGAANKIYALDTSSCPSGTVFVTEANDNGNPLLGTLNLSDGKITVLGNSLVGPHDILYVPSELGHGDQ